ncbi:WAS/WASL-interacting protein family member 3-like [Panthera pardus]|uniref:WAS/WASL-interacting protein family member 3-like n=1 Tax=Panthera pardus TaxID=9691 RepID=A0A9W2V5G8_PANPR|nr:WAS/WASL-interacting protein family member 3-like [Panthera pardus]
MLSVKKKWLAWVPAEAPALLLEIKCSRRPPPPGPGPAASAPARQPRAAGLTGRPASPARWPRAPSGERGGRGGPTASAPEPPHPSPRSPPPPPPPAAPRGPGAGPAWRRRQAPPPPPTNGVHAPAPGPAPSAWLGVSARLTDRSWAGRRAGWRAGARARARETEGLTGAWRARGREAEGRVAGGEGGRPGTRACERVRPSPLCEPASERRGPSKAAFRGAREPSRASQNLHVPEAPRAAAVPTAQPPGAAREAGKILALASCRPWVFALDGPPRCVCPLFFQSAECCILHSVASGSSTEMALSWAAGLWVQGPYPTRRRSGQPRLRLSGHVQNPRSCGDSSKANPG